MTSPDKKKDKKEEIRGFLGDRAAKHLEEDETSDNGKEN
jgi:hypothetical protein